MDARFQHTELHKGAHHKDLFVAGDLPHPGPLSFQLMGLSEWICKC